MDSSKIPEKDKNEKSLWSKFWDWNEKTGAVSKRKALKERVRANAAHQRYKVGK